MSVHNNIATFIRVSCNCRGSVAAVMSFRVEKCWTSVRQSNPYQLRIRHRLFLSTVAREAKFSPAPALPCCRRIIHPKSPAVMTVCSSPGIVPDARQEADEGSSVFKYSRSDDSQSSTYSCMFLEPLRTLSPLVKISHRSYW